VGTQATQNDKVAHMQVLSLDQAAYRAGIVRRTLERMLAEGTGPEKVQISERRVGILEADLERWLNSRRRPAPGQDAA
jgi:predicted DNA-binding transcriptional regulator AlpA